MYAQDTRGLGCRAEALDASRVRRLKGRDQQVARAALQSGLELMLQPYLTECCADLTWELERFPAPKDRRALGDQVDAYDLEQALPIRRRVEDGADRVRWVIAPPAFNCAARSPKPVGDDGENPHADAPALAHFHSCEYSDTGYFGNEGSDTDFYVYAALLATVPPANERRR